MDNAEFIRFQSGWDEIRKRLVATDSPEESRTWLASATFKRSHSQEVSRRMIWLQMLASGALTVILVDNGKFWCSDSEYPMQKLGYYLTALVSQPDDVNVNIQNP